MAVRISMALMAFSSIVGKAGSVDPQIAVAHQMYERPFVTLAAIRPKPTFGSCAALAADPTRRKTN
jgi:hypothetical protein